MWKNLRIIYFLLYKVLIITLVEGQKFNLDLNDILNDQLMPATLLLQPFARNSNITRKHFYSITKENGTSSMNDALNVMKFHRSKMNEYMASNFIAKQIISTLALNPVRMQRRLGIATEELSPGYDGNINDLYYNYVKFPTIAGPNSLLYDVGSTGYKKWLAKSTTLEDIQRQFALNSSLSGESYETSPQTSQSPEKLKKKNRNGSVSSSAISEETEENDENDENDYEEGEVSGYIYPKQNVIHPTTGSITNPNLHYINYHNSYPKPQQVNYVSQTPVNYVYTYHKQVQPSQHSIVAPVGTHVNTQPVSPDYENVYRKFPSQIVPTANSKSVIYYQNSNSVVNENIQTDLKKNAVHQHSNQNYNIPQSSTGKLGHHESKKQGYYGPTSHEHYEQVEHHYPVENNDKKEINLKDVLDIALTTLAFLSFGMFILQVLMCITMSTNPYNYSSNMMMMTPMDASGETIEDGVEEIRRKKRSIETDRIQNINELSKRILLSIDGFLRASDDNGKCLQRILCENNLYARQQKDEQKIWIPIWSLSLSWVMNTKAFALQNLKATAIGLGGGNCESFKGCNMGSRK